MTPRVRCSGIERTARADDIIRLARQTGHSRFPVIGDDWDDIDGLVHVKKAIAVPHDRRPDVPVSALMVPPVMVPETIRLDPLLLQLRAAGLQMVVVVDEYGGTSGVVDPRGRRGGDRRRGQRRARPVAVRLEPDGRRVLAAPGLWRPDQVRDQLGAVVPDGPTYETVGGFVMAVLGRIPVVGDELALPGWTVRVARMDGRRVDRLRFIPKPDEQPPTVADGDAVRGGVRMSHALALWISVLLLLGNAFFVGAEFAAMAARRSTLEPMAAAGSARARMSLDALEHLGSMLATAQLGITICSVGLGALAEVALHEMLEDVFIAWHLDQWISEAWLGPISLFVALNIVVYFHVVIGEMIPKNLAIAGPDRAALLLVPALLFVSRALRPLVRVMEWIAKGLVRLVFRVEPKDEITSAFTADEVAHIVAESHAEGLLEEEREGLVRSALDFSDKVASQVAVPVDSLVTVSFGATPADIEKLVARYGYSRFPVRTVEGEVTGYLHLKDILYADDERQTQPVPLKRVRRLATVSPNDDVDDVLGTMQHTGAHLARVVDADGVVSGVVFLEDVLEELVGEVSDATQR